MTILEAVFVFVAAALGFALGAFLTAALYADDWLDEQRSKKGELDENIATDDEGICDICHNKGKLAYFGDYMLCTECCTGLMKDYFNVLYKNEAHKMYAYISQVKEFKERMRERERSEFNEDEM